MSILFHQRFMHFDSIQKSLRRYIFEKLIEYENLVLSKCYFYFIFVNMTISEMQ